MNYQLFAPLDSAAREALKEDIALRGVLVPVEMDELGNILDGHNRVDIAEELGLDYPRLIRAGMTEEEKRSHVRKVNLLRRHLNQEQKRAIIAEQLKDTPQLSDRQIAAMLGVSHPTVGVVRADLLARGELENLTTSIGADGKEYPRERAPQTVFAADESDADQAQTALDVLFSEDYEEEEAEEGCADEDESFPVVLTVTELKKQVKLVQRPEEKPAPPLPSGVFNVVYADPPWRYDFSNVDAWAVENHYHTMTPEQIAAFGVKGVPVTQCFARDAILFLWVPVPKLPDGLLVLSGWGFTYKTGATWIKTTPGQGMGYYFRVDHELLLVGTKGNWSPPPPDRRFSSLIEEKKGKHSAKPRTAREIVERMYPDAVRLELFAREPSPGWLTWGNEA